MTKTSLKARVMLVFVSILTLSMLLQSIAVLFLNVRASIREDVEWAQIFMQMTSERALFSEMKKGDEKSGMAGYDKISEAYRDVFSCLIVEVEGQIVSKSSPCRFQKELISRSLQSKMKKVPSLSFAGEDWKTNVFGSEVMLLSMPLVNSSGHILGSISAERSLQPIYSRYQKDMGLVLSYLIVNVILFSVIGFFRFVRIFFKPMDKLVLMAENYQPDEQSLLPFSDDESAFRKLSTSLNTLFDRIKRDNLKLRNTVNELEDANSELKEKTDLIVRSEKLASAGRLSAGLAHEIGNPLSIIQGYVELLGGEDLSSGEKKQFSENAQQELDRIKKLIRQLLDFSRPVREGKEIISVNLMIDEVIDFVSLEKTFSDCTIKTDYLTEHDELVGDKDTLRQVLINVLFNAVDATAEDGNPNEIIIATYNIESIQSVSVLVISIKDRGVGIAEDDLNYIFDPFFTTKEIGRGTGLGLFVCHTIMERMGGSIAINNRRSQGIEVRIELPLQETTSSPLR